MSSNPNLNTDEQHKKADRFRALHHGSHILIALNAWDTASAKVFEQARFSTAATTSAGIASAYGYPDGEWMSGMHSRIFSCKQNEYKRFGIPLIIKPISRVRSRHRSTSLPDTTNPVSGTMCYETISRVPSVSIP